MTEAEFLEAGKQAWRRQAWQEAMDCYDSALAINPQSHAAELKNMVERIIRIASNTQPICTHLCSFKCLLFKTAMVTATELYT